VVDADLDLLAARVDRVLDQLAEEGPRVRELVHQPLERVAHAADVRLGFLTGSTRLYDRLTADETVRYYADLSGVAPADFKIRRDRLFAQLGIDAFADRRVAKLSTGMKQKVSIARTIIHDPDVVIFDEATSGLDVIAARAIIAFIRQCRADGKTVLFSTHIMSEVTMLADDLAIVYGGKLLYTGTFADFTAASGERSLEDEFVRRVELAEAQETRA
jgi:sodium transport system ATP-binding protein